MGKPSKFSGYVTWHEADGSSAVVLSLPKAIPNSELELSRTSRDGYKADRDK